MVDPKIQFDILARPLVRDSVESLARAARRIKRQASPGCQMGSMIAPWPVFSVVQLVNFQ